MSDSFQEFADRKREAFEDLPGLDGFSAKPGTAVHEMAGAIRFWHGKAQNVARSVAEARRDGFLAGIALSLATTAVAYVVCHFLI